jgi:hypothetical protein
MTTPLSAYIDIDAFDYLNGAEVRRGEQTFAIMTTGEDLELHGAELEAFDREQIALCRKFAASDDFYAALKGSPDDHSALAYLSGVVEKWEELCLTVLRPADPIEFDRTRRIVKNCIALLKSAMNKADGKVDE